MSISVVAALSVLSVRLIVVHWWHGRRSGDVSKGVSISRSRSAAASSAVSIIISVRSVSVGSVSRVASAKRLSGSGMNSSF